MKNKIMKSVFFLSVLLGLGFAGVALAANASFSLRYQGVLVLDQVSTTIPDPGVVTVTDKDGIVRNVNAQSVLGVLVALDAGNPSFVLSDIQYYESFDSFIVRCITIAQVGSKKCDNWLYVVNGSAPSVGMDKYVLTGGEKVFLYFGPSHQVVLSAASVNTGGTFTATAQNYQYENNAWGLLTGVTIGITKPNPENPWSPIEVLLQAVDARGQAVFTIDVPGQYNVGLKEDFYFPVVPLTVYPPSYSLGGPKFHQTPKAFDVKKAVEFLVFHQNEDGSFGTGAMLSDWVAVALGAYREQNASVAEAKRKLALYFLKNSDPGLLLTDIERRAMALMALGLSPYEYAGNNSIRKILEAFDGTQFGSPELVNDDIFALLVLRKAGYGQAEAIIQKAADFVFSWQREDGSWGTVDMTSAALQALTLAGVLPDGRFLRAKAYLISRETEPGSFGNAYTSSWAIQSLAALGEQTDISFLASRQALDGGLEKDETVGNRIWATAYAIPAVLGKPWNSVLAQFNKPLFSQVETVALPVAQEVLERVEQEVARISKEVAVLKTEVLAFVILAAVEKELERIALETKAVRVRVVAFKVQQLAQELGQPGTDTLVQIQKLPAASPVAKIPSPQVPLQDFSGITLAPEDKTAPLAAEAKETVGAQGLSPQLIILLVIIGGAIFAFSGGMNVLTPLLRKTFSKV